MKQRPVNDQYDNPLFVNAVEKAFKVLEAFGSERRDLSLTEVIERTELNMSAAQRFTHTLLQLGYLEKDLHTRRYRLSRRVLDSANCFLTVDPLVNRAVPHIVELRRQLGVRVGLGCIHEINVMYLIPLQSNQAAFRTAHPGFRVPLHCTSSGRVLLSYLRVEDAREFVAMSDRQNYTPTTLTDIDKIMEEVQKVRHQGYCITDQEYRFGDINAAAPVLDAYGVVVAAVTTACPKGEWSREVVEAKVVPLVMETANLISTNS